MPRACWAAFVWVVGFVALHVHWFAGGRTLRGDMEETYPVPETAADHAYAAVVTLLFAVGTVLPLAMAQGWGQRFPPRLLSLAGWTASALLLARGAAGWLDTLVRETGVASAGLTGLTYEQVTGSADPSTSTIWSGVAIDAIFVAGGVLYGLAALGFRRAHPRR